MEKEKIEKPVAVVKREENKKKKDKKVAELLDSEHTLKLCEFILYEFDLSNPLGSDCFNETNSIFNINNIPIYNNIINNMKYY